ncbi:hypothetical protein FZ103_10245 [Streptomonospora sp. PA3]|uniref:hypothetical protein n=1 Tax=Streptomonospora sp. PA3 TaxID=2607326 RepID=UPI0012DF40D2|nr:hypothetical protein [Streptomonospora sp. PA3]MUL41551.1 hypothetical protein [Streptomonospora sp. PA3]
MRSVFLYGAIFRSPRFFSRLPAMFVAVFSTLESGGRGFDGDRAGAGRALRGGDGAACDSVVCGRSAGEVSGGDVNCFGVSRIL